MQSVLLGVLDEPVGENAKTDFTTSKVGGLPDLHANLLTSPQCKLCDRKLCLVSQVYCPLEHSTYHRTLYIFGCSNKTCWGKSESWKVIRQQTKCVTNKVQTKKETADDWGASEDWGVEADDWGLEADDWGDDVSDSAMTNPIKSEDASNPATPSGLGDGLRDPADMLQEMCVDDVEDDDEASTEKTSQVCVPEDVPLPEAAILGVLNVQDQESTLEQSAHQTHGDAVKLNSYYVNVMDEPAEDADELAHERRLLEEYKRREGFDPDSYEDNNPKSKGKGKGGSNEGYEKSDVKHHDTTFYKFTKRVSRFPQQILRYSYGGSALLISPSKELEIQRCCHCNSNVIFELQLMPSLVTQLRVEGSLESVIEFGAVIICTCSASCWRDTNAYREECLLVQTDPDQHLFKV